MEKKTKIIVGILIGLILLSFLIKSYREKQDFANKIYAKCLDMKSSNISLNSLYSDSYDMLKNCESIKNNAFHNKDNYEVCIHKETVKMGTTMKEYINYIWGGYNTDNGCSGYYLCKPYEEYARLYKDEDEAMMDAYHKKERTCINELLK